MCNKFVLIVSIILFMSSCTMRDKTHTYVSIKTDFGEIVVKLYNDTPGHRDNFIKLVNSGFYEDLLFQRVIKDFMIQGGDPGSAYSATGTAPAARIRSLAAEEVARVYDSGRIHTVSFP